MNLSKFLVIITGALLIMSCTRTASLISHKPNSENVKRFNYLGKHRKGRMELKSGEIIYTENIKLVGDSLRYFPVNGDSVKYVKSGQVDHAYFKDHLIGTVTGALVGLLSGGLTGALVGRVEKTTEGRGWIIVGGGLTGSAVGTITGAIMGSKLKYKFQSDKDKK